MPTQDAPSPTPAELEVLQVLWREGPSTVREVQEALDREEPVGYTTILKIMQKMLDKGLLSRDTSSRAHVYEAAAREEETEQRLAGRFIERVFGGSTTRLVMRALSSERASQDEMEELYQLLDKLKSNDDSATSE